MYQNTIEEARKYDRYGHPHDEERECECLRQAFQTYHGGVRKVLDLTCGTGRHALILARDGYDVTGVDASEGMLAVAAEKAQASSLSVRLVQADACKMDFSAEFDAAYILFNTMTIWSTNEELIGFMEGVHAALRPGGLFVMQAPNYWSRLATGEFKNSTSHWDGGLGDDGYRQTRDTKLTVSAINNLAQLDTHERSWQDGQELQPQDSVSTRRLFSLNELDLLARLTHFETLDIFGAVDMTKRIEDAYLIAPMEDPHHSYVLMLRKPKAQDRPGSSR